MELSPENPSPRFFSKRGKAEGCLTLSILTQAGYSILFIRIRNDPNKSGRIWHEQAADVESGLKWIVLRHIETPSRIFNATSDLYDSNHEATVSTL